MILHGIDTPTRSGTTTPSAAALQGLRQADRVNVIITNPPFGGMEEDGIENNFPAHLRTRETADLFMALVIRCSKPRPRRRGAARRLPVRRRHEDPPEANPAGECNLHTIVRLPNGVFNPYTGIKTNLLFFTKGQWPTKHVWFYEHPYPEGVKSYNKTKPMRSRNSQPNRLVGRGSRRLRGAQGNRTGLETCRSPTSSRATTTSTSRIPTSAKKHLRVENEDCFIDLVFYNYLLKCFVLIDLKIGKLAHQDVGQMDMYVRVFEEQYRAEGDNPTLGLILCSERNEAVAKYSLLAGSQQLFASRYRPFLPSEAELQAELQRDRALLENQREGLA
jgi:hypothetical protein